MATTGGRDSSLAKQHHGQSKFCYKRPAYREAKWERAVKVYTINQESKFLLVQGVPSVGAVKELIELFAIYGAIEEYRYLDEYPGEEFTDVYLIKFQKIQAARYAKKKLDMRSFYGGILHVCYAPEYETVGDTREKLIERRQVVARKCREYYPESKSASHKKINQKIETAARNSEPTSFCHRPLGIPDSHQEPYGFPPPARNPQLPFQTSPHYPALPLPPVNLPPSLLLPLPPPPPPMPLEYPKVPTKNATLPHDLQNSSYNNNATLASMSASTVSPNKQTQQDAPERLSIGSKRSFESHSTAFDGYNHSKGKRIVWHKQPGASTSTLVGQDESQAEPGAWDPYAEIRKQHKSLTGDQNLDDVVLRIRERLKKATEIECTAVNNEAEVHSASRHQGNNPQKKTRKRI